MDAITVSEKCRDVVRPFMEKAIKSVKGLKDFHVIAQDGSIDEVINCTSIELCPNGKGFSVDARRGGGWYAVGFWVPVAL